MQAQDAAAWRPRPGCLCPGPAQYAGPWKQGPVMKVWASASEQLGRARGGLSLLRDTRVLWPTASRSLCHVRAGLGLLVQAANSSDHSPRLTPIQPLPSTGNKAQACSLRLEGLSSCSPPPPLSPTPGQEAFLLRPQGVSADCCLVPTTACSLTRTSLLPDAHFQRLLEGPVSDTPATDDCRFAGAGMVAGAAAPEGTEPGTLGLDEGPRAGQLGSAGPPPWAVLQPQEPPCPRCGPSPNHAVGCFPGMRMAVGRWEGALRHACPGGLGPQENPRSGRPDGVRALQGCHSSTPMPPLPGQPQPPQPALSRLHLLVASGCGAGWRETTPSAGNLKQIETSSWPFPLCSMASLNDVGDKYSSRREKKASSVQALDGGCGYCSL